MAGRRVQMTWGSTYFLFIGGSSMKLPHMPLGLALLAFFTILIFMLIS